MALEDVLKAVSGQLAKDKVRGLGEVAKASSWGAGDVPGWIPSGITPLDFMLGGGLPLGRISEIFSGQESEGKSTLALHYAIQTQRLGGLVVWLESESAIDKPRAQRMGLDLDKAIVWVPRSCEDGFAFLETILKKLEEDKTYKKVPVLFIWDTIAAAPIRTELENLEYGQGIAKKPRVIWAALRKLTNAVGSGNYHLMFVNQSFANMSQWGTDYVSAGGKGIKYHSSLRIDLRKGKTITADDDDKKNIGIFVKAKTVKNKLALPNRTVTLRLRGETGFENILSCAHMLHELGVRDAIAQGGGWYTLCTGQEYEVKCRWRDIEKTVEEDPRILTHWISKFGELWPLSADRKYDLKTEAIIPTRKKS